MLKKITKRIKVWLLAFFSLFSNKNRTKAVLADVATSSAANLIDITSALDYEAVELYGRSPFVK